jgi:hypothetical protein
LQRRDTALERGLLLVRHLWLMHLLHPVAAEHADQGEGDGIVGVVGGHGQHGVFVAQHNLGKAGRHRPDPVLAGPGPLDDVDVRVANLAFHLAAHLLEVVSALHEQVQHAEAPDRGRGPQQYLRGAVLTDHERLHIAGAHVQMLGQVDPEAQAVDQRAGGEHLIVAG